MAEVRIGEGAETEYTEALGWYTARSAQASTGFEAAFIEVMAQLGKSPERFPECDEEGFLFATLNGYPYSLIYRIVEGVVQVIAVARARRRPGYWANR